MLKRGFAGNRHALAITFIFLLFFCSSPLFAQELADKAALAPLGGVSVPAKAASDDYLLLRIGGSILFILAIFGGYMTYLFYLQKKFYQGCRENNQLTVFFNSPAGLPVGTVRAIIALIIITMSLSLLVLSVFGLLKGPFPEVLIGILGTVLGFYFGSRTGGPGDGTAKEQIHSLTAQRDEAVAKQDAAQKDSLLSKIKSGISLSKAAVEFLPEDQKKKYGDVISRMEAGLSVAETLSGSGNDRDAAAKAGEVLSLFKSSNPAQDTFSQAVQSFGQALGTAVPAVAIASTVVLLCTKLAGTVYQKWKARVLHAPFSPVIIPLQVIDANTGFTLMLNSSVFKRAFSKELEENDRPFMESGIALLNQLEVEDFWTKYKNRFETREQFENGLEEFRRAAADLELESDVPAALVAEAGGYKTFMASVDKINADPQAKASLDKLVIVNESLHKNGEPVLTILDKVKGGA